MRDYYLGLDLGTGSVGWAVTDPEYNILKKNGKALWGVRLFDGAQTAEARRINRTSRRRLARRNWRIKLLQELFSEEIAAVDPGFYLRMKESKYYPEDKLDADGVCPELPYALFVDANFTDKEYHALFPTVYPCMIKVREMNDLHHAKDAYLNIVVGNTYFVKFTKNPLVFLEEKKKGNKNNRRYNLAKIFKPDKGKGSDVIRNGETAWKTGKNGTIVTVAKTMSKNNILVTKMVTEKSGKLFDVTIEKKGPIKENIEHLPLKSSDTRLSNMEKYGSYCSIKGSYFVLVRSKDKKGKEIQTIESVPLYLKKDFDKNEESFIRYLENTSKLKEPKILLKLKIGSLLVTDGFKMRIASKSETSIIFNNANQLILQPEKVKVLKKALKYADRKKQNKNAVITSDDKLYDSDLMLLYDTFITKLKDSVYSAMLANKITTLEALKENFEKATIEDKCIAISELLHLFQCDASMPNLKIIGGTGSGRIKKTKVISGSFKNLTLVTQSVTGIFEKKVDLLSLS